MELIKTLSEAEIEQIRDRTEELLETVGLRVDHAGLLRMCQAAGAAVDEPAARVRFPRPLLRELLASVPSSYTVGSPGGLGTGGWRRRAVRPAIVTDPWIVDYETQKPRRPASRMCGGTRSSPRSSTRSSTISLMDFPVTDVPEPNSSMRAFEEHVLHHDKHIYDLRHERGALRRTG